MARLQHKVAIITGGAHGIGCATAQLMAGEGASVVVADIDVDAARSVAARIEQRGGKATGVSLDAMREESIRAVVQRTKEIYGRIDILHNNVGGTDATRDHTVVDMDWSYWHTAMALNLESVVLACRHAIPMMIDGGGGSIINTSSMVAAKGDLRPTAYACAKGAVVSLTRFIATQYGRHNIRCNAISPGFILTPRKVERPKAVVDIFARHTLVPYHGQPDDVGHAAVFLASDESRFITGQVIDVDGGMHCHNPTMADLVDLSGGAVHTLLPKSQADGSPTEPSRDR
jgi:NAD(P)-dependent dehydrogenase (short-subunit alcohol dehydrogenase family)